MKSLQGYLLVASPALEDPNFHKTVVLIVRHSADEGTLGPGSQPPDYDQRQGIMGAHGSARLPLRSKTELGRSMRGTTDGAPHGRYDR